MRPLRVLLFGISAGLAIAGAPGCSGSQASSAEPREGGNDGGADGGAAGGLSLDAYCAGQIAASCAYAVRCGIAESGAACEALVKYLFVSELGSTDPCAPLHSAIEDGRIAYHPDQASACLDVVRGALPCELVPDSNAVPACVAALEGKVAQGGSCFLHEECGTTDYCTAHIGACPGTCQPRKDIGEPVAQDERECKTGLYAYVGSADVTCQAPSGPGDSCAPLKAGGQPQHCASGYFCSKTTNKCAAFRAAGAACSGIGECAPNLECRGGTCQALVGLRDSCSLLDRGMCRFGLTCDAAGVCSELGALGGRCWTEVDCHQPTTLYCSGADLSADPPTQGVCAPRKTSGAACAASTECDLSLFCSVTTHLCEVRKARGVPCRGDDPMECQPTLECLGGVCSATICRDPTP